MADLPVNYEPSPYETHQIARMMSMVNMSMRAQALRRTQWRRNEQMMAGDHFAVFTNLDPNKSRVVYNMCFDVIETIMPILADLLPKPEVKPEPTKTRGQNLRELLAQAQKIEDGIQHQWNKAGMRRKYPLALKASLVYGQQPIRILKNTKNPNFLDIELVDNFAFFLDGGGATSVQTSQWIFTAVPVYITELIRTYGKEQTAGIVPEGALDNFRAFHLFPEESRRRDGRTGSDTVTSNKDVGTDTFDLDIRAKGDRNRVLGQVLLYDFWSKQKILGEPMDPDEMPVPVDKYHHLTFAGKRVLVDKESPYAVGDPPFTMIVNYPQAKSPWGIGESEQIETLNVAADVLLSEAVDGAVLGGNPPVTATEDMKAANPGGIKIVPRGTIWLKTRASLVAWMETKQISPALVGLPIQISDFVNTVSGVHEASRGRKPGGVTAASAIAKLQDAANNRIRYKEKSSLRGPLEEIYTKVLKHIQTLKGNLTFLARQRTDGREKLATYGPDDFKTGGFVVTAGVPITENKVDLVNLLTELAPLLALQPDEMVELLPAEIRNLIQSVRNRFKDQGPLAGLDMEQLTGIEIEVLKGDDEDQIMAVLASLQERGLYSPPIDQDLQLAPNGRPGVQPAT